MQRTKFAVGANTLYEKHMTAAPHDQAKFHFFFSLGAQFQGVEKNSQK